MVTTVTEDGEVITPDDPAAGVKRATTAFRELLGRTAVRQRRSSRSRSTAPPLRRTRRRTRFGNHAVQMCQGGAAPLRARARRAQR